MYLWCSQKKIYKNYVKRIFRYWWLFYLRAA